MTAPPRRALAALIVILATALVAPAAAAATPAAPASAAPAATDAVEQPAMVSLQDNSTTSAPENNTTAGDPPTATQVRINPVHIDEPFLSISVREPDTAYSTQGPVALFSLSQAVESARITQQPATATVLSGGHQVKVAYTDDAAPLDEESLYTLELFFADDSTKTVELYATKTGVSVAASELEEYAPVLEELKQVAEGHGYETSPEALENYLAFVNERADLVDGFLTKTAAQLFALGIAASMNWLFWLFVLGGLALLNHWIRRKYGGIIEVMENDEGVAKRKRDELERAYEQDKQTADEEPLSACHAIGSNDIYWEDAYGVKSTAQLANMAARGMHRRDEHGDLVPVHQGADDLTASNLETSWLEPVLRSSRIPTARQALGELKAACQRMETQYNRGDIYRPARDRLEAIIEELDRQQQTEHAGMAARGDD